MFFSFLKHFTNPTIIATVSYCTVTDRKSFTVNVFRLEKINILSGKKNIVPPNEAVLWLLTAEGRDGVQMDRTRLASAGSLRPPFSSHLWNHLPPNPSLPRRTAPPSFIFPSRKVERGEGNKCAPIERRRRYVLAGFNLSSMFSPAALA